MGTTGDPNRLSPAGAPRAGGVLAQARGAQGRSGRATGRLPGSAGFVPRAVPQRRTTPLPHLRRLLAAGQGRPGITISGTAAGSPEAGAGLPAAPAPRTRHRGPKAWPWPWLCAGCPPAGSDRAHFLPGPQPRPSRRGHPGEPGHAATPPGRGRVGAACRLAFKPLSTSRTLTGNVRRSVRPSRVGRGPAVPARPSASTIPGSRLA